jgi:hypothetical protein
MSALEQEIIEKFRQLGPDAKQRILELMKREIQSDELTISQVLAEADNVRITLRPDANGYTPTAAEMVNEVRGERDADIMRSIGWVDDDSSD